MPCLVLFYLAFRNRAPAGRAYNERLPCFDRPHGLDPPVSVVSGVHTPDVPGFRAAFRNVGVKLVTCAGLASSARTLRERDQWATS